MELSTNRCDLRRIDSSDVSVLWSAVQSEHFAEGIGWDGVGSQSSIAERIDGDARAWETGSRFAWVGFDRSLHEVVGGANLQILTDEPEPSTWLLSYWSHPSHVRNRYATEIAAGVLTFGFTRLLASRIWAGCALENEASRRVIEKLGLIWQERNPCGYTFNGVPIVTDEYSIASAAWQQAQPM